MGPGGIKRLQKRTLGLALQSMLHPLLAWLTRGRIKRAIGWAGASKAVSEAARYLRVLILARLLAPQDFGVFGIALLVLGVLEAFTEPGFKVALVQRPEGVRRYLNSVFIACALRGFALGVLVWAIAPLAARFWNVPESEPVIASIGVVVALRGLANPAAVLLERELAFGKIFVWNCLEAAASLCVGVLLAWQGFGPWALAASLIAGEAARSGASYYLKPWRPTLAMDWQALRDLTRFSRWVMASNAAVFVGLQLDSAFVAKLVNPAALGFYQIAQRLASIPRTTVVTVLSQVAYPAMSASQGNPLKLKKLLVRFWLLSAAAAGGFALALAVFAKPVVVVMLGQKWAAAAPLVCILALSHFLRSLSVIPSYFFLAAGHPAATFRIAAARAAALAVCIWPLTAVWDAAGAAWACVGGAVAMNAVWTPAMIRAWPREKVQPPADAVFEPAEVAAGQGSSEPRLGIG